MQNQTVEKVRKESWWNSSIGRKQLIGITGLGLSGFVLIHMIGNMLIMVSPQAYNEYSHKLTSNPLIYLAEIGLIAMFCMHFIVAIFLSWMNFRARDYKYAMRPSGEKRTSWTKRSLWAQGLLILVFVILHLITFKYGAEYTANYGTGDIRDLHKLAIEVFHDPLYVGWYILALLVLGFHLSHGVGSSLQTLGIHHPRYQCYFRMISRGYAVIVTLGFISQPLYVYFLH